MSVIGIMAEEGTDKEDVIENHSLVSHVGVNEEIFSDWKDWLNLTMSKGTILRYSIVVKKMLKYFDKPIPEITYSDLVEYLNYMDECQVKKWDKKLSTGTQNNIKAALRRFWKYLTLPTIRIVEYNIALHLAHKKQLSMGVGADKILTVSEVKNLLKSAKENPRNFTLLNTYYYAGLRRNEAQQLKWENIHFKEKYIKILNGKGDKDRDVTLNSDLAKVLRNYQKITGEKTGYIFKSSRDTYLSRHTIAYICYKYAANAGITKKFHPHMLRHSHATHRIQNEDNIKNVSMDLGHESVQITMDLYYHPSKQTREHGINTCMPSFL